MRRLLLVLALALPAPAAPAVEPDEFLADPSLEQRARAISRKLRCVVCQNQSIDDSEAPLARNMRLLVRDRLVAGDSDRETVQFLVDRYGDFVLLAPPFRPKTLALWLGPAAMLLAAVAVAAAAIRRRRAAAGMPGLTAAECARLDALLAADADGGPPPGGSGSGSGAGPPAAAGR